MKEIERKLATIRRIDEIRQHPNADAIELAIIGGWQVVIKKDQFQPGELVILCEVDSWIPIYIAPFLCNPDKPKYYEGIEGERLRTIKLRGELSQGLVISTSILPPEVEIVEDADLTEFMGIQKWERPISPRLAGLARGSFPSWIRKTEAERCQNLKKELFGAKAVPDREYEVTVKIDGSSTTFAWKDGEYYVCSRNINLKTDNPENAFVEMGERLGMKEKLAKLGLNIAIQGELFGAGICRNNEKIKDVQFAVFSVWDIDAQRYLTPIDRNEIVATLGLPHVPVLRRYVTFKDLNINSMEELITFADGPSWNLDVAREGVVFKSEYDDFMFKAISNEWLLKNKE